MRADLNKQLCERERVGHDRSYKDVRRSKKFNVIDEDGANPDRESMKHRHVRASDTKSFNENLNPLWGAVRAAVGRPWDKFYSELCQNFDKRSVINQHILQHLDDRVARNLFLKGDELWLHASYGGPIPFKTDGDRYEYFVDPRDGILKLNKGYRSYKQRDRERAAKAEKEREQVYREIDKNNVLHKINDVWFHFTLEDVPEGHYVLEKPESPEKFEVGYGTRKKLVSWDKLAPHEKTRLGHRRFVGETVRDVFTGETLYREGRHVRIMSYGTYDRYGSVSPRYHATKKTASHKVLKQAGVI